MFDMDVGEEIVFWLKYLWWSFVATIIISIIMLVLNLFHVVSTKTGDIVSFSVAGVLACPFVLRILYLLTKLMILIVKIIIKFFQWFIDLFPEREKKYKPDKIKIRQPQFNQTLTCTKSGTKINYYPLVIYFDTNYFYYLKCRIKWIQLNPMKEKKIFIGEEEIETIYSKYSLRPAFLQYPIYIDTTTLFKMKKSDFVHVCKYNKVECGRLSADYIKINDRNKIKNIIINNLFCEKPKMTLITCHFFNNKEQPNFQINYCPENTYERESELLKKHNLQYEFSARKDKKQEIKRIKNNLQIRKNLEAIDLKQAISELHNFAEALKNNKPMSPANKVLTNILKPTVKSSIPENKQLIYAPRIKNQITNNFIQILSIVLEQEKENASNNQTTASNNQVTVNKEKIIEKTINTEPIKVTAEQKTNKFFIAGNVYKKELLISKKGNEYFSFLVLINEKESHMKDHMKMNSKFVKCLVFSNQENRPIFETFKKVDNKDFVKLVYEQKQNNDYSTLIIKEVLEVIPITKN